MSAQPLVSPLLAGGTDGHDGAGAAGDGGFAEHAGDAPPPARARQPCLGSWRLATVFVLFFANIALYIARSNISVAVIYIFPVCSATNGTTAMPAAGHSAHSPPCYNESEASILQGDTLGAFYWGYFASQVPAGFLSGRFGGKVVITVAVAVWIVATFGTTFWGTTFWALYASRVVIGACEGFNYPCQVNILSNWIPKHERSRAWAFVGAGEAAGTIVALQVCPYLNHFLGWESIFWFSAAVSGAWLVGFLLLVSDDPGSHRCVSAAERDYIHRHRPPSEHARRRCGEVPWCGFLRNVHFWGVMLTHICYNWSSYFALSWLPDFLNDRYHVSYEQLGILSVLPYLALFALQNMAGFLADFLEDKAGLRPTFVTQLCNSLGLLGPAVCFILLSQLQLPLYGAVGLFTAAVALGGFATAAGYWSNFLALSPKYSSQLLGISNSVASLPGVCGNYVVGAILAAHPGDWELVFFIAYCILVVGAIIFVWMGSGEEQDFDAPRRLRA